jgi:hypothetical protein
MTGQAQRGIVSCFGFQSDESATARPCGHDATIGITISAMKIGQHYSGQINALTGLCQTKLWR